MAFWSRKKDEDDSPSEPGHDQLELVTGGHVRRMVFHDGPGRHGPTSHHGDDALEAWDGDFSDLGDFDDGFDGDVFAGDEASHSSYTSREYRAYVPKHVAPIDEIEYEIDNLNTIRSGRTPKHVPVGRSDLIRPRTVYQTDHGRVSSAKGLAGKRQLYVEGERPMSQRRFRTTDVDPLIAHVGGDEEEQIIRETVTEYVPRSRTIVEEVEVDDDSKEDRKARKRAEKERKKLEKAQLKAGVEPEMGEYEIVRIPPRPDEAAPEEPEQAAEPIAEAKPFFGYQGDVHKVIEIEGIGPKYAQALHAAGVETTARLVYEDPMDLAGRVGAPPTTVEAWQAMSELAMVKGIGPQFAEAMARAGISGIAELKKRSANAIAEQVNTYLGGLKTNVLGSEVSAKRIETWKKNAKDMRKVRMDPPDA